MTDRKHEVIDIMIGFTGVMCMTFLLIQFNRYVLMSLPLPLRMVLMIILYWSIALVPVMIIILRKEPLTEFGFSKAKILRQVITGILSGAAFSALFTLIPHMIGLGDLVSSGTSYQYVWQFFYDFVYSILAVGLTEEFIFRGFIYRKIERVSSPGIAILLSSVMFGMFHIFNGNITQVVMTTLLGVVFCICKYKLKDMSILSLGIAHGIYDALIVVLEAVF